MMKKRTEELMQMLSTAGTLETYWAENREELLDVSLGTYLHQLLQQYSVMKNEVINRSGLNQIYGYQIFAGTKQPSRDKLIALIFAFPPQRILPHKRALPSEYFCIIKYLFIYARTNYYIRYDIVDIKLIPALLTAVPAHFVRDRSLPFPDSYFYA